MAMKVVSSSVNPRVFLEAPLQQKLLETVIEPLIQEVPPSFFALPLKSFAFLALMKTFRTDYPIPNAQEYKQFIEFLNKFFNGNFSVDEQLFSSRKGSSLFKALGVISRSASVDTLEKKASSFLSEEIFIQDSLEFRAQYTQEYTDLINFYFESWGNFYQPLMNTSLDKVNSLEVKMHGNKKNKGHVDQKNLQNDIKRRRARQLIADGIGMCLNLARGLLSKTEMHRIQGGIHQNHVAWNHSNSMMCLWLERLLYLKQVSEKELKGLSSVLARSAAHMKAQIDPASVSNRAFHLAIAPYIQNAHLQGHLCQSREAAGALETREIADELEKSEIIASKGVSYNKKLLKLAKTHLDALGFTIDSSIHADCYQAVMEVTPETPDTHVPFLGKKEKASKKNSAAKTANKKNKKGRKSRAVVKEVKAPPGVGLKSDQSSKPPSAQIDVYEAYGVTLLERARQVVHANEEIRGFIRNSHKNGAYHFQALCQSFDLYKKIIKEGSYFYLPVLVTQLSLHEHKVLECLYTADLAQVFKCSDDLEGYLTHDLRELNTSLNSKSNCLADLWSRYPYYYQWLNTSRVERIEHLLSREDSFDLGRHETLFKSIQETMTYLCGENTPQVEIKEFIFLESCQMQQRPVKFEQIQGLENKIKQERSGETISLCEKERVQMDLAYCDALWHLERLDLALKLMEKFPECNTVHSSGLIFHMQFFLEQYYLARCIREGKGVIRCGHNLEHYTKFVTSIEQNFLHDLNIGTMTSYLDWSDDLKSNKPYANYALRRGFELNRKWHQEGEKIPHGDPEQFNANMHEFVLAFLKVVEPIISKPVNFISV